MDTLNPTTVEPEGPDEDAFEPSRLLAELKARANEAGPTERPLELSLDEIKRAPELFQPRGLAEDERHVQELARAVKQCGLLDPVLVKQIGRDAYLIDGHHRLLAYELARVTSRVPVQYFEGTIEEAVLEGGRANTKAKLPMSAQERQDFAWRLVLLGEPYSKAQTVEAAGVSDGQVAIMRRAKRALGSEAYGYTSWWKAHRKARGLDDFEMSDEDREAWKEALAARYADRIGKACGPAFRRHPEIAAMALERCFGRRLEDLVRELLGHVSDVFMDDLRTENDEF